MNIKLIGFDCKNGIKLKKILNRVKEIYKDKLCIENINDLKKYNIKNKPALIINGVLVSEGVVLSDREILNYLKLCEE